MADDETTYRRKDVLLILGISDSSLLRMKGRDVHPWIDPDDPSGRRLLYDRQEIDNLARRLKRRGIRGGLVPDRPSSRPPPAARRPKPATTVPSSERGKPPESNRKGPETKPPDSNDNAWEKEIQARRARGEPEFPDDPPPPSRRKKR